MRRNHGAPARVILSSNPFQSICHVQPVNVNITGRSPVSPFSAGRMPGVTTSSLSHQPTRRPTLQLKPIGNTIKKPVANARRNYTLIKLRTGVRFPPVPLRHCSSAVRAQCSANSLSSLFLMFCFFQVFAVNAGDTPFVSQVRALPESPDSVAQLVEQNVSPSTRHRSLSRNQPLFGECR